MRDFREVFDRHRHVLAPLYAELTWEQKAVLLKGLIEAGDHPPGFIVSFSVADISDAERVYLRAIGIGPFPDGDGHAR